MTQEEFLLLWQQQQASYEAWGVAVREEVFSRLKLNIPGINLEYFLKIPPKPRVKTTESLLEKAFFRSKNYANPYLEIEDKVGIRFVVLLTTDIDVVQKAIEGSDLWDASLDKDFHAEREQRPSEFLYQSKHYVVRSRHVTRVEGVEIPVGTPCEIQVRTLLQHAHSELTHDTIYKREEGIEVSARAHRAVAKSMALIEAVDDYFISAVNELSEANKEERAALDKLSVLYQENIGTPAETNASGKIILQAFKARLANFEERIQQMLLDRPFIVNRVRSRASSKIMFKQPWILLVYLMVEEAPILARELWPFPEEEVRPVYIDLGKGLAA